jgi:hypothetical protein
MKVLDLFSGLRGWSEPFEERGHEIFTIDIDPRFKPNLVADILEVEQSDIPWAPDIILASPPCETFSVASIGRYWPGGEPSPEARRGLALVHATLALIEALQPAFAVIENPRGMLRRAGVLDRYPRVTVWYCRYGEERAKPTDLWGAPFPPSWVPRPECRNGHPDHTRAPRGSRLGTQGIRTGPERAKIPRELALEICLAAERDLERWTVPLDRSAVSVRD